MTVVSMSKKEFSRLEIVMARRRRERVGELIQIDGSTHHWFENLGRKRTLLAYIDDATSRIQDAVLMLQYDKVMFLLQPNAITRPLARKRVTVIDYPGGDPTWETRARPLARKTGSAALLRLRVPFRGVAMVASSICGRTWPAEKAAHAQVGSSQARSPPCSRLATLSFAFHRCFRRFWR
jgi:hypothetical protein